MLRNTLEGNPNIVFLMHIPLLSILRGVCGETTNGVPIYHSEYDDIRVTILKKYMKLRFHAIHFSRHLSAVIILRTIMDEIRVILLCKPRVIRLSVISTQNPQH